MTPYDQKQKSVLAIGENRTTWFGLPTCETLVAREKSPLYEILNTSLSYSVVLVMVGLVRVCIIIVTNSLWKNGMYYFCQKRIWRILCLIFSVCG